MKVEDILKMDSEDVYLAVRDGDMTMHEFCYWLDRVKEENFEHGFIAYDKFRHPDEQ